jgi:Transcription elongation factor, GreA/GreB, C-term
MPTGERDRAFAGKRACLLTHGRPQRAQARLLRGNELPLSDNSWLGGSASTDRRRMRFLCEVNRHFGKGHDVQRPTVKGAEPVYESHEQAAAIGTRVRYHDESAGDVEEVTIVLHAEADFASGLISSDSPLAGALLGHVVGDPVRATTPGGVRRLRIMAVEAAD